MDVKQNLKGNLLGNPGHKLFARDKTLLVRNQRKTYFQIKVNKSGRCQNLRPGQVPWGNFCCDCSCWSLIFMLFSYFVYIVHFTKFTHGSSLFMEKSLLMEKSKAEESPWKKNIIKNRPKLRKKSTTTTQQQHYFFTPKYTRKKNL